MLAVSRTKVIVVAIVATSALVGCPGSRSTPEVRVPAARTIDDTDLRIRIARAEARRGGGLDELIDLANHGDAAHGSHARMLALRGLGRIGGPRAVETIRGALADDDVAIIGAAAGALGVTATLDEPDVATTKLYGAALSAVIPRAGASRPLVLEALGRAGDPGVQLIIVAELAAPDARVREAAALALGRFGRRKLAIAPAIRAAVVGATRDAEPAVRYAATWALAREHEPPSDDAEPTVTAALIERVADTYPEVRAQAVLAFARRKLVTQGHLAISRTKVIEHALLDRDWRVAVEAVRALGGDGVDDASRDAVAAALVRTDLAGKESDGHIVLEGLRLLAPKMTKLALTAVLTLMTQARATTVAPITAAWVRCLGFAAIARTGATGSLQDLVSCTALPPHLLQPIVAELIVAKVDTLAARRDALQRALAYPDARVRAVGIGLLPAMWADGDADDHRAAVATIVAALGATDPILVGAATEVVPALLANADPKGLEPADRRAIEQAIVSRATRERDPEIAGSLLELIGKHVIVGGIVACRAGLDGPPVRTAAARGCLTALGESAPPAPVAIAAAPPVDVTEVIGKRLVWHLETSRGEITIALRPDIAPWAVATIVGLTRKHYYDGLALHRVVPDFVVQGGDPTMSGTGGPGFTIPAEPGTLADGLGFAQGGVGIADAGRDSGGSQWFIMHAGAPHLDGRYTWIGSVETGQKSADALQIGDRVVRASIEQLPAPTPDK